MVDYIFYLLSKLIKKISIPSIRNSSLHSASKVCSGTSLYGVTLSKYSYIGSNCSVICADIGSFCSIADCVTIGGGSHPIDRVSTSPVFHSGRNILKKNFTSSPFEPFKKTFIGHDVWIGCSVLIKSGVSIGNGAVIGMGAVVTKDVGPYEVWGGNPAKLIKKRFDDETIGQLLEYRWWDLTDIEISDQAKYFDDPKFLLEKVK